MVNEYIRKQDAVDLVNKISNLDLKAKGGICVSLANLEKADVVPVVRCENCVHWSDSNQCERPELAGNRWHDDKYFETLPDDFCSYGERKED